jgi:hypothetical protein
MQINNSLSKKRLMRLLIGEWPSRRTKCWFLREIQFTQPSKTRILTKIWSEFQRAKAKMKDFEHEFIGEKNELLESVCDLTKQLDVVDLLLIRSRSESELATLMSAVERLRSLNKIWRKMEPRLLRCCIQGADGAESAGDGIILRNVQYSRGTTTVSVEHLVIGLGIYALTGANKVARAHYFDHLNR